MGIFPCIIYSGDTFKTSKETATSLQLSKWLVPRCLLLEVHCICIYTLFTIVCACSYTAGEWRAALHPPGSETERPRRQPERPDPIGGFAFVKIDQHRALMFGGQGSNGRVNEARLFNLDERVRNSCIHNCRV